MIRIGTGVEERGDRGSRALVEGVHERRPAVPQVEALEVGTRGDEAGDGFGVAAPRRHHERRHAVAVVGVEERSPQLSRGEVGDGDGKGANPMGDPASPDQQRRRAAPDTDPSSSRRGRRCRRSGRWILHPFTPGYCRWLHPGFVDQGGDADPLGRRFWTGSSATTFQTRKRPTW
ncbi:MAG: hypothetical protein R2862_12010 [Thermoanaerobaculia bacterium]